MADTYFVKPAKLVVRNGEIFAQVEMDATNIKELLVNDKAVTIISNNGKTQIVEFLVEDITKLINAKIHVVVEAFNYDHWYDIRFQFDTSDLPLNDGNTNQGGGSENTGGTGNSNNGSGTGNSNNGSGTGITGGNNNVNNGSTNNQSGTNQQTTNNTTNLNYDRTKDGKVETTKNTTTTTAGSVENAKTGDHTQILWYVALLLVSMLVLGKKLRIKTL
ncbi:sortase B protein-sorting domain-containing protein [Bacillus sp. B1-b2]|nr:sortase B protein-sorting domain-containing protein [Bacillus sp. B1-b2]